MMKLDDYAALCGAGKRLERWQANAIHGIDDVAVCAEIWHGLIIGRDGFRVAGYRRIEDLLIWRAMPLALRMLRGAYDTPRLPMTQAVERYGEGLVGDRAYRAYCSAAGWSPLSGLVLARALADLRGFGDEVYGGAWPPPPVLKGLRWGVAQSGTRRGARLDRAVLDLNGERVGLFDLRSEVATAALFWRG